MKARAKKKMLKKAAIHHAEAAAHTAQHFVSELTPSKKSRAEAFSTLTSGAASLASLLGGVWTIANSDVAKDLLSEVKQFRRRNNFGKQSAGTWIALGAGAAAVATGAAFFLGTQSGQKVRDQVAAIAKPYFEKAVETANDARTETTPKNTDGLVRSSTNVVS